MRLDYIRFRQKATSRFFMADGRFRAEADMPRTRAGSPLPRATSSAPFCENLKRDFERAGSNRSLLAMGLYKYPYRADKIRCAAFVDENRNQKTERGDAVRDLVDLLVRVCPRVAGIGLECVDCDPLHRGHEPLL